MNPRWAEAGLGLVIVYALFLNQCERPSAKSHTRKQMSEVGSTYCERLLSEAPNRDVYQFILDSVHSKDKGLEHLTCGQIAELSEKCRY